MWTWSRSGRRSRDGGATKFTRFARSSALEPLGRRRCPTRSDCAAHNLAFTVPKVRGAISFWHHGSCYQSLIAVRFRVWGAPFASMPDHGERQQARHSPRMWRWPSRYIRDRCRAFVKHAAERQSSRVRRVLRRGLQRTDSVV